MTYNPNDFIDKMKKFSIEENSNEKLERFISLVAPRVEEALQSNELINVFQDDFEMLGETEGGGQSKIATHSSEPLPFSDIDYSKNKRVSCIAFHPLKPYVVALSFLENLSFDDRAEIAGKSYDTATLVLNFADNHIITCSYVLETAIEINAVCWHPENSAVLVGGCISGQVTLWDMSDELSRVTAAKKPDEDEGEEKKVEEEEDEEEKTQHSAIKMRSVATSGIVFSHKSFVADLKFVIIRAPHIIDPSQREGRPKEPDRRQEHAPHLRCRGRARPYLGHPHGRQGNSPLGCARDRLETHTKHPAIPH